MSKYLRSDFAEWKMKLNSPRGSFIVVVVIFKFFVNLFSPLQIPKTVQLSMG